MTTKSLEVQSLFEQWIRDADAKLVEENLLTRLKEYFVSQHPEICGKCAPCRDGVVRMERLIDQYIDQTATLKTLKELELLTYNLRASRCSVGLEIGKNMEVILKNHYHVLYNPVKKY